MKKITKFMAFTLMMTPLAACETTTTGNATSGDRAYQDREERIDAAIEKAAVSAARSGSKTATLIALEKKYKRNSDNPAYALPYAQALRQADHLNRAELILAPFAKGEDTHPGVKTEMSMIKLATGDYDSAEEYAKQAILQNPEDYQAYQNLGIALDAKEMHAEAERAFRKGLEYWEGDPTTIMNNLALNLATQGFVDEAIEILERAKALSPDRIEIERNLRIIRTLNER